MTLDKKLVIVAGASRGIGKSLYDHYQQEGAEVIGISRSDPEHTQLDLTDSEASQEFVQNLDLDGVGDLVYIHSIGIDKFEPDGEPEQDYRGLGIDQEVFESNVATFRNVVPHLLDRAVEMSIPTTVVGIGSVSDKFDVPYWQSFTKCNNMLRAYLSGSKIEFVKGVMLNVSSTLDEDGRKYGRVNADTTYWQTADELVAKAVPFIKAMRKSGKKYGELEIFKHDPNYSADYFTNLPALYELWKKDLGYEGREIPQGIII